MSGYELVIGSVDNGDIGLGGRLSAALSERDKANPVF